MSRGLGVVYKRQVCVLPVYPLQNPGAWLSLPCIVPWSGVFFTEEPGLLSHGEGMVISWSFRESYPVFLVIFFQQEVVHMNIYIHE